VPAFRGSAIPFSASPENLQTNSSGLQPGSKPFGLPAAKHPAKRIPPTLDAVPPILIRGRRYWPVTSSFNTGARLLAKTGDNLGNNTNRGAARVRGGLPQFGKRSGAKHLAIDLVNVAAGVGGFVLHGQDPGDHSGYSVSSAGDINGDGFDDVLAGSPDTVNNGYAGVVRVINGNWGGTIREQEGDAASEAHGWSICGMGDVDGDGVPDYAVGAIHAGSGSEGRVRICSGSDGATIYEWYGVAGSNHGFGSAVASGDWNGDGVADLAAGDWLYNTGITAAGCVDVYLMAPASWTNYGTGWAGTLGIPSLTAAQKPVIGAPLDVQIGNSLGANTNALLFIGFQSANLSLPGNGTLLVTPLLAPMLPLPTAGLTLSSTLPNDPALCFLDLYLQALELDPLASKGISFTPGLQLRFGFDLP
jgi:hypothetical protein